MAGKTLRLEGVKVVWGGDILIVEVDGARQAVPRDIIQPGSEVSKPGDRGALVIPEWLASSPEWLARSFGSVEGARSSSHRAASRWGWGRFRR